MSLNPENLICHSFMFEHEDGLMHLVSPRPALAHPSTHWEHAHRVATARLGGPGERKQLTYSHAWVRLPDLSREEALKLASSDIVPWVTYYPYAVTS